MPSKRIPLTVEELERGLSAKKRREIREALRVREFVGEVNRRGLLAEKKEVVTA